MASRSVHSVMEIPHSPYPPPEPTGGEIVVKPPPEVPKDPPTNLVARLLPVVTIVAMAGMMALYFSSGATTSRSPALSFFPAMMLVSVLGSVAFQSRGMRRGGELDADRRSYLRYLDELAVTIARFASYQHDSLHERHPPPGAAWALAGGSRRWERRRGDVDFGSVRIGSGALPLAVALVAPDLGEAERRDPVTADAVARLVRQGSTVDGLPVTVNLLARSHVAVLGHPDAARALVRAMLCQLAVWHGPDVVEVATHGAAADVHWDWLKWLPHQRLPTAPRRAGHRVLIVDGGDDVPVQPGDGITVVTIGHPPAEGCLRLDAEALDGLTLVEAGVCARRLTSFTDRVQRHQEWSDLVGIGDPVGVTAVHAWRSRTEDRQLRVAIGVCDRGEPVELDLKEAARGGMGPHGLCVGATGSGKSEFLRTLVLGLIATHGPDALNLVLVDFKGGATFLGLERLHHVAAVVTNLSEEAHLVARMADALAGEMTRRQRLLRAAGPFANLADYRAARDAGADLAALPVLFIVVDEFSELLSQHPDFAELFVAIGRLGRSLGMHLLLASQRLDEGRLRGLETHLSYRVCLKTFSASESRAVLGTADAYELPATPGAALLKTSHGELVRFQTAFVSGPLAAPRPRISAPTVFTARSVRPVPDRVGAVRVFDAVVSRLAGHGAVAHRVWVPPLDVSPPLGTLLGDQPPLVVPIGLVDNPFAQRRDHLVVDLRAAGGNAVVVGGPRSGKTTTLQTLMLALAATHDPATVQMYVLDLGAGELSAMRQLPHVGAVAGRAERELVRRIVAHVQGVVRDRDAQRRGGAEPGAPAEVFLVVDGWAVLRREFDTLDEAITAIAAQGLSVGVHVVVTASRWGELRPALKDQLGTRIELCLGDPADSEMDRRRARLLGSRPAGHGITRDGLEFCVALPRVDGVDAVALTARARGLKAPPVRLLPLRVPWEEVVATRSDDVTIGLDEVDLRAVPIDFDAHPHLLVLGDTGCGKTATLRTLCRELVRVRAPDAARLLVIDPRRTLLGVVESDHLVGYAMSVATAESQIAGAVRLLQSRLPGDAVTQRQLRERSWWSGPDVYVIVDDYDLVAVTSGHPLLPLVDLLPHARDLGLHVVVARRSGGAARAMFDPVLGRLRDLGCMGLMMSAGPDEGVLLGSARPAELPAGRGTLVRRGYPDQLIQVAWTEPP